MSSIKEYFSGVGKGLKSLVTGMAVTGKEFVTPKITEQYPENRDTLKIADRFRACGICQMNCPNGTISLTTKMVDLPDGKKKRKLDKYMYDLGSCTFCMLCVTTCPQDALEFSNDFEQAVFTRSKLVHQLNYRPEPADDAPAPAPKPAIDPEQLARIKAEALAKAAKIKAEKEAAAKAAAASAPAAEAPAKPAAPAAEAPAKPAAPAAEAPAKPAAPAAEAGAKPTETENK